MLLETAQGLPKLDHLRRAFIVSSGLIALSTLAWLALAPRVRPAQAAAPLIEAARAWT